MRRLWRPLVVGLAIVIAVFALAKARIFEPSAPATTTTAPADPARGSTLFAGTCAGCHGDGGVGGDPGPRLVGSGLSEDEIEARIEQGVGVMPAGLVSGQDEADVVAYVVSIASP
jgi:mono/diheme cytochrome c family protein